MQIEYYFYFIILMFIIFLSICRFSLSFSNSLQKLELVMSSALILLLAFFSSFRYSTPDYESYKYIYNKTPSFDILFSGDFVFLVEPIFHFFILLEKLLIGSYSFFLFLSVLLPLALIMYCYRLISKEYALLSFLLYLSLSFVFLNFIQFRQGISCAITLLSMIYYMKGYKKSAYFYIFISAGFHVSALILIPFYLLYKRVDFFRFLIFTPVVVLVFWLTNPFLNIIIFVAKIAGIPQLSAKVQLYIYDATTYQNLFSVTTMIIFVVAVISYIYKEKLYVTLGEATTKFIISVLIYSLLVVNLFPSIPTLSARFIKQTTIIFPVLLSILIVNVRFTRFVILDNAIKCFAVIALAFFYGVEFFTITY